MQEFCQKHGIKQVHGVLRKLQTQGLGERNSRSTWCSKLVEAVYKQNITINRAVKEIPYQLVFGIDPKKESKVNPTQEKQVEDQVSEMKNKPHPLGKLKTGKG